MWLYKFPKFIFGCWLHNLKVLFLCLKEAGCSVHTAPGFLHTEPWILHKPSERDIVPWPHTFCGRAGKRRCKTGAGTAFGVNGDHEQGLCLFTRFALQNFQRALRFDFWNFQCCTERAKASIDLWPQIFNAWKIAVHSVILVGECLPQTLLMRLAPLKNPSKYFSDFSKTVPLHTLFFSY